MKSIFVLASLNVDMVATVKKLPQKGETVHAGKFRSYFGGKGANQGVAASKLGGKVCLYGKIGKDINGKDYQKSLSALAFEQLQLDISETQPTGMAFINVSEAGENEITVVPGANLDISAEEIKHSPLLSAETQIVISQFEVPEEATLAAYRGAKILNPSALNIFNPAPALPISQEMWNCIDVLIPNETEIDVIAGRTLSTTEERACFAETLVQQKALKCVVITLGGEGALLVTPSGRTLVPAEKVEVKDTTAAGDSFIGAFARALMEYSDYTDAAFVESARYANLAASFTVQTEGAQASLPTAEQLVH